MSFNQSIKGTILPKVPLKELFEEDTSRDSVTPSSYKTPGELPDSSQKIGSTSPFVKIAGQIVKGIELMTIDETGFIPTISLTFKDDLGEFAGDYFPKTNLIMNVYLKVSNEKLKPIRCDFLITSVKSITPANTGKRKWIGIGTTYIIKGELYVPNIYLNVSKSYASLNSKDTLKKVCDELGLGFAENNCTPNDKMTWLNPNQSSLNFLQTVISHAYQSDDSFFMGFIDKYYYLNFIEVNQQLKIEEAGTTFSTSGNSLAPDINQKIKNDPSKAQLEDEAIVNYLTTEIEYRDKSNYISSLNLISDQGAIIKKQGYKKHIYYYDHLKAGSNPKEKFKDFFMTPLKSIDRSQQHFLVPTEISLAENEIKKWMNIDYGNNHVEWNAARLINAHNIKELDKIKLKVSLNNINFQAIRGFVVPVYVTVQEAEKVFKSSNRDEDQDVKRPEKDKLSKQTIDAQLSGYYYISGAKYHYDVSHPNGLYTELFLARREWKPSKKTE